jgi:hypothetical protein
MRRRRPGARRPNSRNHKCRILLPPASGVVESRKQRSNQTCISALLISAICLLASRKEVIQPQVPLRLPCYDFTPVADLTVVGWLPFGLPHRLRVKPTPMV